MPRGHLHRLLALGAMVGIGKGIGLKLAGIVPGKRQTAGNLDPAINEEFLHRFNRAFIREPAAPINLDVNLVDLHLTGDPVILLLQLLLVVTLGRVHEINGYLKILVIAGANDRSR